MLLSTPVLWVLVSMMLVLPIAGGLAAAHSGALLARVGTHLKTSLTASIYAKALVFRNDGTFSSGEVQNLMSIDAQQLLRFAMFAPLIVTAPVQIIVCLYLITLQVGQSAWAGIGFLLLLVPVNVCIFGLSKTLRSALLRQTDARVKLMTEVLQGIRLIKFFAWEGPMVEKISRIRARELVVVKKVSYVLAIGFSLVLLSAPVLLPIIVFADFTARGGSLTAARAFTTIALFGALRFSFAFLPMVLLSWAQASISIGRISRFLDAPEIELPPTSTDTEAPIKLDKATFQWPSPPSEDESGGADTVKRRGCCGCRGGKRSRPAGARTTATAGKGKGEGSAMSGGGKGGKAHASAEEVAAALKAAEKADDTQGCCGEAQFFRMRGIQEPLMDEEATALWTRGEEDDDEADVATSSAPPVGADAAAPKAESSDAATAAVDKDADAGGASVSDVAAEVDAKHGEGVAPVAAVAGEEAGGVAADDGKTASRGATPQVRGATLEVRRGELLAIVGRVGAGKSTLLQGMMGEVPIVGGSVLRAKRVAYVPQAAWITNETVRDNILFGEPVDEVRLAEAVRCSQLGPDLKQLPRGMLTLIGERGVSLSGGQKQRVSLARAVYAGVETVLMDDPLSSVDAHVGEAIFTQLVLGALAGTTRVLVTNALQYLSGCDRVLVIEDGVVQVVGSWEEVKGSEAYGRVSADMEQEAERRRRQSSIDETDVAAAARDAEAAAAEAGGEAGAAAPGAAGSGGDLAATPGKARLAEGLVGKAPAGAAEDQGQAWGEGEGEASDDEVEAAAAAGRRDPTAIDADAANAAPLAAEGGSAVVPAESAAKASQQSDIRAGTRTVEQREVGSVNVAAYAYYLTSGGLGYVSIIILMQLLGRASELGAAFWVSYWAEQIKAGTPEPTSFFLNMYALVGCVGVLFITLRAATSAECRVRASYLIHERLLRHVVRAPAAWFDDTPVGRILNRFAGDIEKIDEQLPPTLTQLLGTGVSVAGAMVAIAVSSNGVLVIALVPLLWFYYLVQAWYRRSSTELQRVESLTRSPIYVSFDATLDGLTSIRAYDRQASFVRRNHAAINANTVPSLLLSLSSSWLAMRLDSIGALLAFGVAAVAAATTGFIPAGWVGVGLSTALEMTAFLKHGVRMLAQAETMMNSVERVKEFSEETPVEAKLVHTSGYLAAHPELVKPPATWPAAGHLKFEGVKMRYGLEGRQGPEVLRGISFEVPARAKVGLVGRTGSGKSSTSMALFRIVELCGGSIKLDGIDISKVALGRLRSSLAIVPQDPVLFSPSVRANLDPFNKHSDKALRRALRRVELDGKLDLDDDVTQGGTNLSQGTRQLVCIARAILRRPRVLVMDEATASVDERTDEVVQRAMREAFKDATVLVIAHRLRTIADSDLVMVLDAGCVAEFDHPHTLLADKGKYPDSQFRALVSQTREQQGDIHRLARRAAAAAGVPVVADDATSPSETDGAN